MYLFGFPEGLTGGSKETSYITNYNTSHTTSDTINASTYWATNRTTSKSTGHSRTDFYYSGLDKEFFQTIYVNGNFYIRITGSGVQWYALYGGSYADLSSPSMRALYGYGRLDQIINGMPSGITAYSADGDPTVNTGKIIQGFLKVGTYHRVINGGWAYGLTICSTATHSGSPITGIGTWTGSWSNQKVLVSQCIDKFRGTFSGSYTGATSWSTYSHNTSQSTLKSASWATSYLTNRSTSHVTYG